VKRLLSSVLSDLHDWGWGEGRGPQVNVKGAIGGVMKWDDRLLNRIKGCSVETTPLTRSGSCNAGRGKADV